jgi:hypothetical protein
VIVPAAHAKDLDATVPELAARLRRSDARITAERYRDLDEAAVLAQAKFVEHSARARRAVLWAGVLSALLVATGAVAPAMTEVAVEGIDGPTIMRWIVIGLSVAAVGASAFAATALHVVRTGHLLETWMAERANAEGARLAYFDLVTRPEQYRDPLFALEYFRRYQLDVQCAYFRTRGVDHQQGGDRRLLTSAVAIGVAAAATALAGLLSTAYGAPWAAVGVVALAAQAVVAHEENAEATAQHRRNAERYARMYGALMQVATQLDAVREATVAGEIGVVRPFVTAVHEPLAAEYAQWQTDIGNAGTAVAQLGELLKEYEAKRAPA